MAIYLGSTLISSNPTGTGALYLGSLNICDAYLENTQVFDNCNQPNTSVVLTVVNAVSGGGETLVGDLTGATKSGQPGTSFTAFNTSVSLATYYSWASGPTFSGEVGGTFPATGSISRTTTVGGSTSYNPPASTGTYTLVETGSVSGVSFGYTDANPQMGTIGSSNYGWTITATLASGYVVGTSITVNGSIVLYQGVTGPTSSSITLSGPISQTTANIPASYSGSASPPSYSYGFSMINNVSNSTASQSVSNLSGASVTGTSGNTITIGGPAGSTWDMNAEATPNTNYVWSGGSQPASANQTVSGTMPANNYSGTTITLTGTTAYSNPATSISLGQVGYCSNEACIDPGSSTTWWYQGSLQGATLWANSSLTGANPAPGYYSTGGGTTLEYSGGVSSTNNSCYSSTTYIALGDGGNSVTACNDPLNDYFYVTGSTNPQSMNGVWDNQDACTGAGADFYSDGNSWNQTNSSGLVINFGTC